MVPSLSLCLEAFFSFELPEDVDGGVPLGSIKDFSTLLEDADEDEHRLSFLRLSIDDRRNGGNVNDPSIDELARGDVGDGL